jgi:hypothetical protein
MLSRRQFMSTAAGATGAVLSSGLWMPALAEAHGLNGDPVDPKPIPIGIQPFGPGTEIFHVAFPGPVNEPSLITDFHGLVGVANLGGTGTGTNTTTGASTRLLFDLDNRFMKGVYIGVDGKQHTGTFAFI